jgi:hypothetical protein
MEWSRKMDATKVNYDLEIVKVDDKEVKALILDLGPLADGILNDKLYPSIMDGKTPRPCVAFRKYAVAWKTIVGSTDPFSVSPTKSAKEILAFAALAKNFNEVKDLVIFRPFPGRDSNNKRIKEAEKVNILTLAEMVSAASLIAAADEISADFYRLVVTAKPTAETTIAVPDEY